METVYVIEKLIDFTTGARQTFMVCRSSAVANEYLNNNNGMQLVMLANGNVVPEYEVTEYIMF